MSASHHPNSAADAPAHRLGRSEYRTLALSALGGALEFYDFIVFVFFVTVISHAFFPPESPEWIRQVQAFGIFAAGYLARPLGGIVMAHFGDRFGRKRMFTLSILLMALSTLGVGLLPTYASIGHWAPLALLLMRVMQGAAIGGEIPGAWVFVAEHVPERKIGFACGTLTAGLTSGILLGSLVATAINTVFTPEELNAYAWRVPFFIGGIFGLVSVYLRRWLEETPVFRQMQSAKSLAAELPLKTVLRDHFGGIFISLLLTWLLAAAVVVMILMTPTFLQTLHGFTAREALAANSVATLTLTLGCLVAGALADRVGAGRVFIVGSALLAAASYAFYAVVPVYPHLLVPFYAVLGATVGLIGAVPYVMVKSFPPAVRFTGISFSFNIGYAICGGLTPMLVSWLLHADTMGPAYYVIAVCAVGFALGLYFRAKERAFTPPVIGAGTPVVVGKLRGNP